MAEKTRIVAVRLVRIEFLSKGGEPVSAKTRHLLSSTVHWPRYAYQARTTAREVEISGAVREYGAGDWIDAILFKESVQLPSAATFKLSVPVSRDEAAKAVAAAARAGMTVFGNIVEAAAPTAVLGKVATAPVDALASMLGNATDPGELGRASILFDEPLIRDGGERTLEFKAEEAVETRVAASPTSTGAGTRRRKTVVRKGAVVARAVVAFDPLG